MAPKHTTSGPQEHYPIISSVAPAHTTDGPHRSEYSLKRGSECLLRRNSTESRNRHLPQIRPFLNHNEIGTEDRLSSSRQIRISEAGPIVRAMKNRGHRRGGAHGMSLRVPQNALTGWAAVRHQV